MMTWSGKMKDNLKNEINGDFLVFKNPDENLKESFFSISPTAVAITSVPKTLKHKPLYTNDPLNYNPDNLMKYLNDVNFLKPHLYNRNSVFGAFLTNENQSEDFKNFLKDYKEGCKNKVGNSIFGSKPEMSFFVPENLMVAAAKLYNSQNKRQRNS